MTLNDWEKRYAEGRVRCRGSMGKLKNWKWRQIRLYAGDMRDAHVIDVGCGDARFWTWKQKPKTYHGIDISRSALASLMKVLPMARVSNVSSAHKVANIEAPVVLCVDLVFHLMDFETVQKTLINLCEYSTEWVFIYTWVNDPSPFDETFQAYWDMARFSGIFELMGFGLRHLARTPLDPVGGMYVFKKDEVGLLK